MALPEITYAGEKDGVISLQIAEQSYYALKAQPALPAGDSRKIIVCNEDGSAKLGKVSRDTGAERVPYIGSHLPGFDDVAARFVWPKKGKNV